MLASRAEDDRGEPLGCALTGEKRDDPRVHRRARVPWNEVIMPAAERNARFWDRIARKYAASPVSDEAGYERTLERTRSYLKSADAVLEFGCGTGATAVKLAPSVARYVATDVSPEMIAIARERAQAQSASNIEFAVATPEAASLTDASFDAALGFNILHLLPARADALAAVRRLLKPGGVFVSKTPCLKEMNPLIRLFVPLAQAIGQAPYVAFLSAEEVERDIAAAGFEIVERGRHGARRKQEPRIFIVARKP
jgi:ubiquinone/menaquinone biosynthesis C-methylase UbiE